MVAGRESPVAVVESPSDGAKNARTTAMPIITSASTIFARRDSQGRFFTGVGAGTCSADGILPDCIHMLLVKLVARTYYSRLLLRQEILRAIIRAEHIFRGSAHPAIQHGGIDGAKINGIFQVAIRVEVAQAGRLAKDALVDGITQHEHGRSCAVIGSLAAIFFDAAPELGPCHHYHIIGFAMRSKIIVEGGESICKGGH